MTMTLAANGAIGILPVLIFLAVLAHFDSFHLVRFRTILIAICAGALVAFPAKFANTLLYENLGVSYQYFIHFVSPVIEEGAKALLILALLRTNRIGFAFDAVIIGFAIGAGFALIENFHYLRTHGDEHPALWMVRGFGTAIMHGSATAMFAMASHYLTSRETAFKAFLFVPGFVMSITLHAAFNSFLEFPVSATIAIMAMLSSVFAVLLHRESSAAEDSINLDFERHRRLLEAVDTGDYESFRLGRLLQAMHARMGDERAKDIIDYIRTHTELVLKAEAVLVARRNGEKPVIEQQTVDALHHLHALERRIGKTGRMALQSHLAFSRHEFFELYALEKEVGLAHSRAHRS